MVSARFAAADAALTRLLGPEIIASPDMVTLAAADPGSRPGAAARKAARSTPATLAWTGRTPRTW